MYNPKVAHSSGNVQMIDYTPNAAVPAGSVIIFGGVACFALQDILANALGALAHSGGVWIGNKDSSTFAVGDPVYWKSTGNPVVGTAGTGAFTSTATGATFVGNATSASATGDQFVSFVKGAGVTAGVGGVAAGYKVARGQATTVTAADTIATGLSTVVAVVASLDSDPVDNPEWVSSTIGDQAGSPAAGSFILKTWQNTSGTDPTPTAATTFGKKVNWIAIGT